MTYQPEPTAVLTCTTPGCATAVVASHKHLANLTATGGWRCHRHATNPTSRPPPAMEATHHPGMTLGTTPLRPSGAENRE